METETWKPIKGYEGLYEVSDLANIKSINKTKKNPLTNGISKYKDRIIKPFLANNGYLRVAMHKDGIQRKHTLSVVVATAYCPNPLNKPKVNHLDGNKLNNRPPNLEWCTVLENNNHSRLVLGNDFKGERVRTSKLKTHQVIEIRKLYFNEKISVAKIAPLYNITPSGIYGVICGTNWNHI